MYDSGVERRRIVAAVNTLTDLDAVTADRPALRAALAEAELLRRWVAARDALIRQQLAEVSTRAEHDAAEATDADLVEAERLAHRAELLGRFPELREALERGDLTPEHVDSLDRVLRSLDDATRACLSAMAERVVELAMRCTPRVYAKKLRIEAARLRDEHVAAEEILARQQQARRLRTWVDEVTGMVHLNGVFDPVTGMLLWRAIDQLTDTMHAAGNVDGAPADPRDRQAYLRAMALLGLTGVLPDCDSDSDAGRRARGRPTVIVVVDTTPDDLGVARVDWGLPVGLPMLVLQRALRDGAVRTVMIRNGVISDPDGVLDHGRDRRLATTEQRHALQAVHPTCAIPGCEVPFQRCKIHHVTAWDDGGLTDLANLLPICPHHHRIVHQRGWQLHLTPDRTLTITTIDGTRTTTGPPRRAA